MPSGSGPATRASVPAWWKTPPASWNTSLDVDAALGQLVAGGLDVVDDEVQALRRARAGGVTRVPKMIERRRAGRRHLHDPEVVAGGEVGVEPPPSAW